jgi:uncharacterized membrane protein
MTRFKPHPHIAARKLEGPVKTREQHRDSNRVTRFNARLAVRVTTLVGSMWCAYAFGAFDLLSLPAAIHGGTQFIVSWVAQTFLQLVLLSVIMVGQNVQARAADKRSEQTYNDAESILHTCLQLEQHLQDQDEIFTSLVKSASMSATSTRKGS